MARTKKTPFSPAPMVLLKGTSPLEVSVYLSEMALSVYKRSHMAQADLAALNHSGVEILNNAEVITHIIGDHGGGEKWKVSDAELILSQLMMNAFTIGMSWGATPEAKHHNEKIQALKARRARSQSAAENALVDAIVAIRGPEAAQKPNKEADRILEDVNIRLAADGFAPVKIDVVRRRLESFPRS